MLNKRGGTDSWSSGILLITFNVQVALALIILKFPVGKVTCIIIGINLRDILAKTNGASHAQARDEPKEAVKRVHNAGPGNLPPARG